MTRARQSLVDLALTPYYHVVGRCVRRAFLCGVDAYSQRDYSHRKAWVVDLLTRLAAGFAVDVAAHAVMSNGPSGTSTHLRMHSPHFPAP